jgi:hypothetical protein
MIGVAGVIKLLGDEERQIERPRIQIKQTHKKKKMRTNPAKTGADRPRRTDGR